MMLIKPATQQCHNVCEKVGYGVSGLLAQGPNEAGGHRGGGLLCPPRKKIRKLEKIAIHVVCWNAAIESCFEDFELWGSVLTHRAPVNLKSPELLRNPGAD